MDCLTISREMFLHFHQACLNDFFKLELLICLNTEKYVKYVDF